MAASELSEVWLEDRRASRGAWGWWVGVALVISCGAAAAAWRWRAHSAPPTAPVPAAWTEPQWRRLPRSITTSGTVRLRTGAEVRVGSQVSGIVSQLNVSVGTHIRAGDVIARIDPRPLQSKLDEARAQVALDEVALGKARRDQQRGRALLDSGLIPRQQAEDLDWAVRTAEAQRDAARAAAADAQTQLSYAVIRAPIAGTVASVSTQEGETVAAAFAAPTFITIVEDGALELDGLVDETDIGNVRPGDPVRFTVETFPDRMLSATVERIDPTAVIVSGVVNYSVVARLARIPGFLRPDMTANLTIQTGSYRALVLPDAAVHRDGRGSYVWIRRGPGVARQPVATGVRQDGWTEITSGVPSGGSVGLGGGLP